MNYLSQHFNNITQKEFISNFYYKNINQIPKIKQIVLNIGIKNIVNNKFLILPTFLALELITNSSHQITKSKKNNINLKIKKNNIIGCKIILKKQNVYTFLQKLILFVLPNIKNFKKYKSNIILGNNISIIINNLLLFPELEKYFNFFNYLDNLNITIKTTTTNKDQNILLLNSLKIPLIK
jgi:large subunit ribosomal protein L5